MMLRAPANWTLLAPPSLAGADLRRAIGYSHATLTPSGGLAMRPVFVVQTRSGALARILAPHMPPRTGVLERLMYRDDRRGD